jgi:hypothetical protein
LEREVPYVVDINPHKQGAFMPGTGQQVVGPESLVEFQPDTVILMNPVYRDEVSRQLVSLGLAPELVCV